MALKTELKKPKTNTLTAKWLAKKPLLFSVTAKDKIFLAKHLAVMIKAGIPLREALVALEEQAATPSLHYLLRTCVVDLEGGQVLAFCLAKFPRVFDPFFANVIAVGETSGTLAGSLEYLSLQLEKARELKGKVRSALIYPIIVFVGALGIGAYLSFFLLPKLVPLFISLGSELPVTTRWLLAFTDLVRKYWLGLSSGLILLLIGSVALWRIKSIRLVIHRLLISLPVFGALVRQIQLTQFARILGTLLESGVKVVPALEITAESLSNLVYQKEIYRAAKAVERGEALATELNRRRRFFNQTSISLVQVGERTGKLSESLLALATFTETEMDNDVRNLSSLIEPVVLIIVGLLVGLIAMSIISPIYQLTQSVTK